MASRRRAAGTAMKRITSKFVLLIATAAILPLVIFGYVAIDSLRNGTEISVREGNGKVAKQVSEQVSMYMRHNTRVLQSVGARNSARSPSSIGRAPRWRPAPSAPPASECRISRAGDPISRTSHR
jgi:hypothetical protein